MLLSRRVKTLAFVVLVTSVAGVAVAFDAEGLRKERRMREQAAQLRADNQRLGAENARLAREVQALRSNPAALERAAREELRFVRPGELVYRLDSQPGGSP
jgi:cell division protein FtsB